MHRIAVTTVAALAVAGWLCPLAAADRPAANGKLQVTEKKPFTDNPTFVGIPVTGAFGLYLNDNTYREESQRNGISRQQFIVGYGGGGGAVTIKNYIVNPRPPPLPARFEGIGTLAKAIVAITIRDQFGDALPSVYDGNGVVTEILTLPTGDADSLFPPTGQEFPIQEPNATLKSGIKEDESSYDVQPGAAIQKADVRKWEQGKLGVGPNGYDNAIAIQLDIKGARQLSGSVQQKVFVHGHELVNKFRRTVCYKPSEHSAVAVQRVGQGGGVNLSVTCRSYRGSYQRDLKEAAMHLTLNSTKSAFLAVAGLTVFALTGSAQEQKNPEQQGLSRTVRIEESASENALSVVLRVRSASELNVNLELYARRGQKNAESHKQISLVAGPTSVEKLLKQAKTVAPSLEWSLNGDALNISLFRTADSPDILDQRIDFEGDWTGTPKDFVYWLATHVPKA